MASTTGAPTGKSASAIGDWIPFSLLLLLRLLLLSLSLLLWLWLLLCWLRRLRLLLCWLSLLLRHLSFCKLRSVLKQLLLLCDPLFDTTCKTSREAWPGMFGSRCYTPRRGTAQR